MSKFVRPKSEETRALAQPILERLLIGFQVSASHFVAHFPSLSKLADEPFSDPALYLRFLVFLSAGMKVHTGYPELYMPVLEQIDASLKSLPEMLSEDVSQFDESVERLLK